MSEECKGLLFHTYMSCTLSGFIAIVILLKMLDVGSLGLKPVLILVSLPAMLAPIIVMCFVAITNLLMQGLRKTLTGGKRK